MFSNALNLVNSPTYIKFYIPLFYTNRYLSGANKYHLFCSRRGVVQGRFVKKTNTNSHNLPFKVQRTSSGNLAVYPKIRLHGTVVSTVVRHVFGDIKTFKEQLRIICESPVRDRIGCLEVQGLHVTKIKKWLVHCGF